MALLAQAGRVGEKTPDRRGGRDGCVWRREERGDAAEGSLQRLKRF